MNQLHHGGLMRCCVQDFYEQLEEAARLGDYLTTACCGLYVERRPDGDWQWVGGERQREMEEQEWC